MPFFFFLKDYRFSVACNTKRMNCFPVLIGIVSNALLGIFNVTEVIKTERSTFPPVSRGVTSVRGSSAGTKGQGHQSLYLSVQPAPCEPSCFLGLSKSGMSSHLLWSCEGQVNLLGACHRAWHVPSSFLLQVFPERLPGLAASRCWRYSVQGTGKKKIHLRRELHFARGE